jgi:FtsZ-binding cell division protein ZapB
MNVSLPFHSRSLHRLTIDELKRQVDMLHGRERQAYEKIDELQKSRNDYEHTVGVLQNKLRQISNDVRVKYC